MEKNPESVNTTLETFGSPTPFLDPQGLFIFCYLVCSSDFFGVLSKNWVWLDQRSWNFPRREFRCFEEKNLENENCWRQPFIVNCDIKQTTIICHYFSSTNLKYSQIFVIWNNSRPIKWEQRNFHNTILFFHFSFSHLTASSKRGFV